jgi:MFS family permease
MERNVAVMSFTTAIFSGFRSLWFPWWSLYLLELGATPEIVGFFTIVQEIPRMLSQLPGGFLSDRFGRKRMLVYCTTCRIIPPILFLFATSWQMLIPVIIFDSVIWGLYMPSITPIIAESVTPEKRGLAFGGNRMIMSIPGMFVPFLSGLLMDHLGVTKGVRTGFSLSIIAFFVMAVIRAKLLIETLEDEVGKEVGKPSFREAFSGILKLRDTIFAMIAVAAISAFALQMVQPFIVLYVINVMGLSKTQWGLIQTIIGIFTTTLSLPSGMLIDKLSRRLLTIIASGITLLERFIQLFVRDFNQILLLYIILSIGAGLSGGVLRGGIGPMGGLAWRTLLTDLVPSKNRGKVMGLMSLVTGITSTPSSVIGGYIWTSFGPDFLLTSGFLAGILPMLIFYFFVREPKIREK